MVFAYYKRLSRQQKSVYRRSDGIHTIRLPHPQRLDPLVRGLETALKQEDRPRTETLCQKITAGILSSVHAVPVRVKVLSARPAHNWGELHGMYLPPEGGKTAGISIWMRTAQRRQVVAFRTFFRTLLHEICHHLDYELLELSESYHTEGFYKRESSLFQQLLLVEETSTT